MIKTAFSIKKDQPGRGRGEESDSERAGVNGKALLRRLLVKYFIGSIVSTCVNRMDSLYGRAVA